MKGKYPPSLSGSPTLGLLAVISSKPLSDGALLILHSELLKFGKLRCERL